MWFIYLACMVGFIRFILQCLWKADGTFEDEPDVANAPDNGEPLASKSRIKFLVKKGFAD